MLRRPRPGPSLAAQCSIGVGAGPSNTKTHDHNFRKSSISVMQTKPHVDAVGNFSPSLRTCTCAPVCHVLNLCPREFGRLGTRSAGLLDAGQHSTAFYCALQTQANSEQVLSAHRRRRCARGRNTQAKLCRCQSQAREKIVAQGLFWAWAAV